MPRRIAVGLLVLLGILGAGLVINWIMRSRDEASRLACQNNLKQIGLAIHNYHAWRKALPSATVPNASLPIEKRLSWILDLSPFFESAPFIDSRRGFNPKAAWDEGINQRSAYAGEIPILTCPENGNRTVTGGVGVSHYVGIAGLGSDAAELPLGDKRCGVFGYDRKITLNDITDGTGATLLVAETALDNGPWTAGGRPTVRGLEPEPTYLGQFGQFSSLHRERYILWENLATNVAFADGSVRPIASTISPDVLEALATIAGGEKVELPGDD